MATNESNTPVTPITPESVVEQLRAIRSQISDVAPLTPDQRDVLRRIAKMNNEVLQATINAIGASDSVSTAIGHDPAAVRQMYDEANRWTAAEDELKTMLNGISGANLIRRQRLGLLAVQAFGISAQLAKGPEHAVLVPHVREISRLKRLARRRKASQTPEQPPPAAEATPDKVE
jgi:hypothetical protein